MIHDIFLCSFRMIDFCLCVAFMVRLSDDFLSEVSVETFPTAPGSHMPQLAPYLNYLLT